MTLNTITDKLARLPLAYGRHVVKGVLTKQNIDLEPKAAQIQVALGAAAIWDSVNELWLGGGWDSAEIIWYNGFEIPGSDYEFHSGGPADAPSSIFASDIAHPKASYYNAKLPQGMADQLAANGGNADEATGIFKCLRVADYNEDGEQVDDESVPIPGGANPIDYLYYSASPMRQIADLMLRARRRLITINWPAWVHCRDYQAVGIDWDDGALTPHQISLTASAGGSLAPATYWVRVATKKGADISSASRDRATDGINTASVLCSGGNLQFTVEWTSQEDRGATGYRVYIGTSEGGEDKFFDIGSGATNNLLVTTLTGASTGTPQNIATGALLRQIPRFESHVFFVPPFNLVTAIDRIAQISCLDWQYANGKICFLTPEVRDPVFTINLSETGEGSFKTYQVDRRQKPNQTIVNYRNLDDEFLSQADPPVTINREALQAREGVRPYQIDMGCAHRSQAERVGNYWARRLIDSDQMLEVLGSPRTYIVLPGDRINVTHDVPNWTDVPFYVESKEEQEDTKAGFQMTARVHGAWYSDTDSQPLPRPLPVNPPSPFVEPPVVVSVTLSQVNVVTPLGIAPELAGAVQFAPFVGRQRGRVWWWKPEASEYEPTSVTLIPDPETRQAAFAFPAVSAGLHRIRVVAESELGVSSAFSGQTSASITIEAPDGPLPTDFVAFFDSLNGAALMDWAGTSFPPAPSLEVYELQMRNDADNATLGETIIIRPAANAGLSELIPLVVISTGGNSVTLVDPSGADIIILNFSAGPVIESATTIEIVGGFDLQFEVPPNGLIAQQFMLVEEGDPFSNIGWFRIFDPTRGWIIFPETTDHAIDYVVVPGDRLGIRGRPDGVIEYTLNESASSQPIYLSGHRLDPSVRYKLVVREQFLNKGLGDITGFRKATWTREGPEFRYNDAAQRLDRGLAEADPLPGTLKARVRQRSFYVGGAPSAWVNGVFVRP